MRRVMGRVSLLPSMLTLGNFVCGFVALMLCLHAMRLFTAAHAEDPAIQVLWQHPSLERGAVNAEDKAADARKLIMLACYIVILAMIFDMLDGRVARMTKSDSHFGAELDSLADVCSFGIAPAAIVATLWIQNLPPGHDEWFGQVVICGAVYASCAVLRLARYNVESGSTDKNFFSGLPSPAAAGAVVGAVLICMQGHLDFAWSLAEPADGQPTAVHHTISGATNLMGRALALYCALIGFLMVTRVRFVHAANRFLTGRKRFTFLVVVLFSLAFLCWMPSIALCAAFNGYVIVSLLWDLRRTLRRRRRGQEADGVPADPDAQAAPDGEPAADGGAADAS